MHRAGTPSLAATTQQSTDSGFLDTTSTMVTPDHRCSCTESIITPSDDIQRSYLGMLRYHLIQLDKHLEDNDVKSTIYPSSSI